MTLRVRLAVGLAFMAAVLTVGGFAVVRTIADSQRQQLDALISDTLPEIAQVVSPVGEPTSVDAVFGQLYVARIDPGGGRWTIAVPANAEGAEPELPTESVGTWIPRSNGRDLSAPAVVDARLVDVTSVGPETARWRAALVADQITGARLLVAVSQAASDETNVRLIWAIAAVAVAGLGAFGLAGWWVVLFGLRPISDVADTARAIVSGDRTRRVELDDPRTEAGQLAQVFNLMVDENERIETRLRRFIADASHELRTPISSIRGFADLYRRGNLDDPDLLADAMRRIGAESARMALLIEDLLLLARLDEGRPLSRESVDLGAILRDAVLDATASHPTRSIELLENGVVEVVGDELRLRQVIANLIQNALTHGGADATVTVGARSDGDWCVIEVRDDGVGMAPEQVERATDRFWRADQARSRRGGGTGLGLAITTAIVASHGGELQIESEVGRGTRVSVRLPAKGAPTPDGDLDGDPAAQPAAI